ncbi:MAG: tetratricopeptide repeat protein [Acidobacteria bacterium]|nr:tetratricopeptide repeat protein [Acidobacteriota bacterium]
MRIPLPVVVLALLCALPVFAEAPPVKPEHDLTHYPILYETPAMAQVKVAADLPYKTIDGGALKMDVYSPPDAKAGSPLPAVVFINGVGDPPDGGPKVKSWGQYTSWPRLMAASGYVAVTHEARGPDPNGDVADLMAYLEANGAKHGIDTARLGIWACSANVRAGLTYAMGHPDASLRAAVFYYGGGDVASLRPDLPVLLVRAGKDSPFMSDLIARLTPKITESNAPWTLLNLPGAHHAFDIFDNTQETRDAIRRTIGFFDEHLKPVAAGAVTETPEREALGYFFQQDWPKTAEAYGALLAKDPNDVTVLARLGQAQMQTRRFQEGTRTLERAATLGEDDPQTYHMLGQSYVTTGQYQKGIDYLRRAVDAHGSNGQTFAFIGLGHAGLKQYDEAARDFERAIEAGPVNPSMHYNLACMYALAGRKDEALSALGRAIDAGYRDRAAILADADLASIKDEDRFKEMMKKLG